MNDIEKAKSEIIATGGRLYSNHLISGNEGNISVRLPEGNIAITSSGVNKGFLREDDIVVCGPDGNLISGDRKVSSEIKLHLTIYINRTDINAICHAHPPNLTAFAYSGKGLMEAISPEIIISLGAVPIISYATPGSPELSENILQFLDRYQAFLLQSHGAVTLGRDIAESVNRMETIERYAGTLIKSAEVGGPKILPKSEVERLLKSAGHIAILDELICLNDN